MRIAINSFKIKQQALSLGFHKVGITEAKPPDEAIDYLKVWLAKGYHADMVWMNNPKRFAPRLSMPEVKSVICVALNYYTPNQRPEGAEYGKISRYAWGRDYHKVMAKKLKAFSAWLESQAEGILTRYYVDTGPIPDKVFAQQAGIGWIGKHGNLITRDYGSWVFLGEILTNLELNPDFPHTAHCGTCRRCLDACPTGAIPQPYVVDANLCIAYHTIENRAENIPLAIASQLQGWVAGCDICQDVCPWNQRFAQETNVTDFQAYPHNLAPKLTELATMKDEEWDQRFRGSALRRIKPAMFRRNARANLDQDKNH
jgi:epoxyqueuosine reductase